MKARTLLAGALLVLAGGIQAHGQGLDPVAYRQWVRQQQLEAQSRRLNNDAYRSYYGLNAPRFYRDPGVDWVSRSRSYYRGPGGEIVDSAHLPKNALSRGYRYTGQFSSAHPALKSGR